MLITKAVCCPHCSAEFNLREYSPGHVGIAVYHCNQCARSVVQHKSKIPPNYQQGIPVEKYIDDCPCGGHFERVSKQRCPDCAQPLDIRKLVNKSNLDPFNLDVTKRDSGEYYVEGFNCDLKWKP